MTINLGSPCRWSTRAPGAPAAWWWSWSPGPRHSAHSALSSLCRCPPPGASLCSRWRARRASPSRGSRRRWSPSAPASTCRGWGPRPPCVWPRPGARRISWWSGPRAGGRAGEPRSQPRPRSHRSRSCAPPRHGWRTRTRRCWVWLGWSCVSWSAASWAALRGWGKSDSESAWCLHSHEFL